MSKVRVYEVAKQLNMDQKTLVGLFQSMGIGDVRNHMSAVESDVVERVKRHLERQKSPEVVEERIRPTVVKRQRRAVDEPGVPPPRPSSPGSEPFTARGVAVPAAPSSHGGQLGGHAAAVAEIPDAPSSSPVRRRPPAAAPSSSARSVPSPEPSAREREIAPPVATAPALTTHAAAGPLPPAPPAAEPHGLAAAPASAEASHAPAAGPAPASAPTARPSSPRARPSRTGIAATPPAMEMFEPLPAPVATHVAEAAPPPAVTLGVEPAPTPTPTAAPAIAPPPPPAETMAAIPAPPPAPKVPHDPPARPAQQTTRTMSTSTRVTARPNLPERPQSMSASSSSGGVGRSPMPNAGGPQRASQPPGPQKTGIETWGGRPGVPMPQVRTGPPLQRRVTYDPRQAAVAPRPGAPTYGPPGGGRPGMRPGQRPGQSMGFRGRPNQMMRKGPAMVSTQEMSSHKKVVKIEEQVTLQQLAGKMSLKATDVLMKLLSMGMTGVHINSTLDAETAKILASEFGWAVEDVAVSDEDVLVKAMTTETDLDVDLVFRPPIVTVMGHVDHGKTSLLDRIRKATVAEGEAGGITQHIGAYRVETSRGTIAFLDTPGHEAFTAMRARGASLTDLVILVVAADDGVMPQTKEALAQAQAAKVPIVVAVNKIDKPGSEPEKIMRDLSALGLQPEEWGGETQFVHVSAKTGQGIDQLLEAVLLQAEVLELKANPKKRASGTVIEALLDRGRGPVARVMVQDGTLHVGDIVLAGGAWGKVRAMTDELGRPVAQAGPATPVEVLGLNEVPSAGDPVHSVKDARTAEEIAEGRRKKQTKREIRPDTGMSLEGLVDRLREAEQLELKLIVKGDVQGSVEAVVHALAKLSAQKVRITIVNSAVGGITEGDVNLAVASKAIIVGFNVRPAGKAAMHADAEGVAIRLYNIIYNAVDDIRNAMENLLPATKVEKSLGKAEVRQVFRITKGGTICGCMVLSGLIKRTGEARLTRDGAVVWTGKLSGLRRFKDDVKEVAEGFECGISLDGYNDAKEGDVVESFEIEEIKTKLS